MTEAGVRTEQHEHVRKAGSAHPQVSLRAPLPGLAGPPRDHVADRSVGDLEARPEDDRVDVVLNPVSVDDSVARDLGYSVQPADRA